MGGSLLDKRVLVIGASAGIGRALAVRAVGEGAQVLMAARRGAELEKAAAEARGGHSVTVDVRVATDCTRLAAAARETLGLPLLAPGAVVMVLSSESVDQPFSALGAYVTSKQALERALIAWRTEHPGIRFCRVRVGQTFPTEFGSAFDGAALGLAMTDWAARGLAQAQFMTPEEVAGVLVGVLRTAADHPGVSLDELMVRSSSAGTATYHDAMEDTGQSSP
jgi:NAD(P)-dependent dehydrogenase (short-subunit alcohol dehydrogenase family)